MEMSEGAALSGVGDATGQVSVRGRLERKIWRTQLILNTTQPHPVLYYSLHSLDLLSLSTEVFITETLRISQIEHSSYHKLNTQCNWNTLNFSDCNSS